MIFISKLVKNNFILMLLSLLIGLIFTYILIPPLLLHPNSIDILYTDPLQHILGWEFFRNDQWYWPITYTKKQLMYPNGTSIVFTDSFPIVSIFFKMIRQLLPEPFIWFGIVAIINTALMFFATVKFIKVTVGNDLVGFISGIFVLFSSVFVWRFFGHFSLTSQWLIIFEMILIYDDKLSIKRTTLSQCLLLFIATGIHAYFVFMIFLISIGLIYKLWADRRISCANSYLLILLFITVTIISAYLFGYLSIGSRPSSIGFGDYSNNLLSLIDPVYGSLLLKPISTYDGQHEGFAYLGLGNIILILIVLITHGISQINKKYVVYYAVLIFFFLFGLSNVVFCGDHSYIMFKINPGSLISRFANIFRSSGRFIWPVYYFLQFWGITVFFNSVQQIKYRKKLLIFVLLCILQILDCSYLFKQIRNHWIHPDNDTKLYHFVDQYVNNKNNLKHIILSPSIDSVSRLQLARIAYEKQATINNFYLARTSKVYTLQEEILLENISKGIIESDSIYLFHLNEYSKINSKSLINCQKYNNELIICSSN